MASPPPAATVPELKKFLFDYLERAPVIIEFQKVEAQIIREKFLALVKAGFTEPQAIELCRPRP